MISDCSGDDDGRREQYMPSFGDLYNINMSIDVTSIPTDDDILFEGEQDRLGPSTLLTWPPVQKAVCRVDHIGMSSFRIDFSLLVSHEDLGYQGFH